VWYGWRKETEQAGGGSMALVQTIQPYQPEQRAKEQVAAYCRVSTDSKDQLNSYHAQVAYYTSLISDNPDWELADIYADASVKIGLRQRNLTARGFWLSPVTFLRHGRPYHE